MDTIEEISVQTDSIITCLCEVEEVEISSDLECNQAMDPVPVCNKKFQLALIQCIIYNYLYLGFQRYNMYDEERNNRSSDRRRNWNDDQEDRSDRSSPRHEKRQDNDETWDDEVESRWKEKEFQNKVDTPVSDTIEPNPNNTNDLEHPSMPQVTSEEILEQHEPSETIESVSNQFQEQSNPIEEPLPENAKTSEETCNNQKENVDTQEGGTTPLFDE